MRHLTLAIVVMASLNAYAEPDLSRVTLGQLYDLRTDLVRALDTTELLCPQLQEPKRSKCFAEEKEHARALVRINELIQIKQGVK